jgi:hypothetical protein
LEADLNQEVRGEKTSSALEAAILTIFEPGASFYER